VLDLSGVSSSQLPYIRVLASADTNVLQVVFPPEAYTVTIKFRVSAGEYSSNQDNTDGDADFPSVDGVRQCIVVAADVPYSYRGSPQLGATNQVFLKTANAGDEVELTLEAKA
jgi:hypothetical protein